MSPLKMIKKVGTTDPADQSFLRMLNCSITSTLSTRPSCAEIIKTLT